MKSNNIESEIQCLKSIMLNISESCQLSCSYCPRSYGYQNNEYFMTLDIVKEIKKQLDSFNYKGLISISGMGEPTLHKDIFKICDIFRNYNLQVISNGITTDFDYEALSKKCTLIITKHLKSYNYDKKFENINVIFKNHIESDEKCSLIKTNRGGWLYNEKRDRKCFVPFYKLSIDYDGSYLLCPDDWSRKSKNFNNTIFNIEIKKYFCETLKSTKAKLLKSRLFIDTCKNCSIDGMLAGIEEANFFKNDKKQI